MYTISSITSLDLLKKFMRIMQRLIILLVILKVKIHYPQVPNCRVKGKLRFLEILHTNFHLLTLPSMYFMQKVNPKFY